MSASYIDIVTLLVRKRQFAPRPSQQQIVRNEWATYCQEPVSNRLSEIVDSYPLKGNIFPTLSIKSFLSRSNQSFSLCTPSQPPPPPPPTLPGSHFYLHYSLSVYCSLVVKQQSINQSIVCTFNCYIDVFVMSYISVLWRHEHFKTPSSHIKQSDIKRGV